MTGHQIARTALLCNAAFCAVCGGILALEGGAALVAGAPPAGDLIARVLGVGLVGFAGLVGWAALRWLTVTTVLMVTASDVAWVLGSLAGIGFAPAVFTAAGIAAIAGVAAATLIFASGQALGAMGMNARA